MKGFTLLELLALMLALGLLAASFTIGCSDEQGARSVLESEGVSNVMISGYSWSCGQDDWYSTGFSRVKNGHQVRGVVCGGWLFKGKTVRYF